MSKHNESSVSAFNDMSVSNDMSAPKVLVVGRNKNVTNEEFDMRDKAEDYKAAEVWSIIQMLMADEQKYPLFGQEPLKKKNEK